MEEAEDGTATMAVAAARVDPVNGTLQWNKVDYIPAMIRTIAMSQMSSMLNDRDRNSIYMRAIQLCIENYSQKTDASTEAPVILDVGSGTGLLSMAAARHGGRRVLSCEMFSTLAQVSEAVVEANGCDAVVTVFPGKSSELSFDDEGEESSEGRAQRPNILVSEILDSALLGESCMLSHADAISRLMAPGPMEVPLQDRVIPHSASVFAHLVDCEEVARMIDVSRVQIGENSVWNAPGMSNCRGGWPLIPVHWEVYEKRHGGTFLSSVAAPTEVLAVDFHSNEGHGQSEKSTVQVSRSGRVHGVLLWWKVQLCSPTVDPERQCVLHTAPPSVLAAMEAEEAADSTVRALPRLQWQDHWVQVVYPLPESLAVSAGDSVQLVTAHDCIHIWLGATVTKVPAPAPVPTAAFESVPGAGVVEDTVFSLTKRARLEAETEAEAGKEAGAGPCGEEGCPTQEQSVCECGWHMLHGSERMQALCDKRRMGLWETAVNVAVDLALERRGGRGSSVGSQTETETQCAPQFVLDVSDGSVLTLLGLARLRSHFGSGVGTGVPACSGVKLVSLETKLHSQLFFRRLLESNARAGGCRAGEGDACVWGEDGYITDINEWFPPIAVEDKVEEEEEEEEEEQEEEEEELTIAQFAAKHPEARLCCLLSECCYYQMHIQPTWSALSFYYKRLELDPLLVVSAQTPGAGAGAGAGANAAATMICPRQGRVMVAAVQCERLYRCHGPVGIVNDIFDHATYDSVVADWHEHCYPYKLGHYDKQMLTEPVCVGSLDYFRSKEELENTGTMGNVTIDSTINSTSTSNSHDGTGVGGNINRSVEASICVGSGSGSGSGKGKGKADNSASATATCHFIAIWVDYQLTEDPDSLLQVYRKDVPVDDGTVNSGSEGVAIAEGVDVGVGAGRDFPTHASVYIKFLPTPVCVTNANKLQAKLRFNHGDSDFKYDFAII